MKQHHPLLALLCFAWFVAGWFICLSLGPVPGQSYRRVAQFADGSSLIYCQPRGGWCESTTEDWGDFGTETNVEGTRSRLRIRQWLKTPAPEAIDHGVQHADAQEVR